MDGTPLHVLVSADQLVEVENEGRGAVAEVQLHLLVLAAGQCNHRVSASKGSAHKVGRSRATKARTALGPGVEQQTLHIMCNSLADICW